MILDEAMAGFGCQGRRQPIGGDLGVICRTVDQGPRRTRARAKRGRAGSGAGQGAGRGGLGMAVLRGGGHRRWRRISYDPVRDGRNRREHGYPLVLAARLFVGSAWVALADDRPLGYEHEGQRVALGASRVGC